MLSTEQIRFNYELVLERIFKATQRSGRLEDSVRLVVVTKSHPADVARAAVEAGARILGENYAEEGLEKIKAIGAMPGFEWHMVGHVQSRKVDLVVENFSLIHSVDSLKLADRINRVANEKLCKQDILVQVNVSGEESKSGFRGWVDEQLPALMDAIESIASFPGITFRGLMTIPPLSESADKSRPFFRRLKTIRDRLVERIPDADSFELSMGMSGDYEVAIEEGATLVRVGTAILGERIYQKG